MLIAGRCRSENHCPVHATGQAHGPSAASGAEKVFAAPGQRQDHAAPRPAEPKAAQKAWRALSYVERAEYLHKAADILMRDAEKIGAVLSKEIAKGYKSAVGKAIEAVKIMEGVA